MSSFVHTFAMEEVYREKEENFGENVIGRIRYSDDKLKLNS